MEKNILRTWTARLPAPREPDRLEPRPADPSPFALPGLAQPNRAFNRHCPFQLRSSETHACAPKPSLVPKSPEGVLNPHTAPCQHAAGSDENISGVHR